MKNNRKILLALSAALALMSGCAAEIQSETSEEQYAMSADENDTYQELSQKYDELLAQHILLEELNGQYNALCEKGSLTEEEQSLLAGYEAQIDEITKRLADEPSLSELQNQLNAIASGGENTAPVTSETAEV